MSHPVLYDLSAWGDTVKHKYCTAVDPVTSTHNDNLWMKWSLHNDVLSLDTLPTLNPVCSVTGETGGFTAMQPRPGQVTAQFKQSAGVLTEDAISWTMCIFVYESLCLYIMVTWCWLDWTPRWWRHRASVTPTPVRGYDWARYFIWQSAMGGKHLQWQHNCPHCSRSLTFRTVWGFTSVSCLLKKLTR